MFFVKNMDLRYAVASKLDVILDRVFNELSTPPLVPNPYPKLLRTLRSEALRLELAGTPIKVTCVEPGLVITDLHRDHERRPEVAQDVAEPLMPEEVAEMIVYALEQPDHIATPRLMILPQSQSI